MSLCVKIRWWIHLIGCWCVNSIGDGHGKWRINSIKYSSFSIYFITLCLVVTIGEKPKYILNTHWYLEFTAIRSSRLRRVQVLILNTVRLAPMLAVYVATTTKPKSHQVADTRRPAKFFGTSPPPWGVSVVTQNQKASFKLKILFSSSSLDWKN